MNRAATEPPMAADPIRSVLVTGAAGGIGAALVEHLRQEGWRVVATDTGLIQSFTMGSGMAGAWPSPAMP